MDQLIMNDDGKYRVLSASQLNKLYNCPRLWAYEYVAGIKDKPSIATVKGMFIHAVVEKLNEEIAHSNPPDGDIMDTLQDWGEQTAKELWEDLIPDRFRDGMRDKANEVRQQIRNYIAAYMDRFQTIDKYEDDLDRAQAWTRAAPSTNELAVRVLDSPNGKWMFMGSIDAVYENSPAFNGKTVLVDYKTGSAPYRDDEPMGAEYSRQLDIYAWMYYQKTGLVPEVSMIHFLSEGFDSPKSVIKKETDPGTIESAELMLQRMRELTKSTDVEDYPRNTDYQWCEFEKSDGSTIKCDHWEYCLGDADRPEATDYEFVGPDREFEEVTYRNPLKDNILSTEDVEGEDDETESNPFS